MRGHLLDWPGRQNSKNQHIPESYEGKETNCSGACGNETTVCVRVAVEVGWVVEDGKAVRVWATIV
jgi:hypothetical protein